jgi:mono/diheme cytochrome c family protein
MTLTRTLVAAAFVLAVAGPAAAKDAAKIEKGKQVYAAQKCQTCHSINGVGNKKGALDEVGAVLKEDEIHEWIVNAPEMTAKTKAARKPPMKAYTNLSKDDLDALVAYISSLKKKP